MIALPIFSFVSAALVAIASSVWLPPCVRLGRPFWLVTLVLVLSALIWPAIFLLQPTDPYGFGPLTLVPALIFFGPIAAGWLFGILVVLLVRLGRIKSS
jgi:hypothetical protein